MAAAGPLGIRIVAVGVQQRQQPVGGLAQPGGPVPDRDLARSASAACRVRVVDTVGQLGRRTGE